MILAEAETGTIRGTGTTVIATGTCTTSLDVVKIAAVAGGTNKDVDAAAADDTTLAAGNAAVLETIVDHRYV